MKIVSWNILSGGFDSYTHTSPRPQRLDGLVNAINKIDADFVSLVDTFRWTEIFTTDDLKQLFGYPNVYSVKLDDKRLIKSGHENGITVLTRIPQCNFQTIWISTRNAIQSKCMVGNYIVDIFSVYLDDLSEDTRLNQIRDLFNFIDNSSPIIFLGDLNTFDREDVISASDNITALKTQYPDAVRNIEPQLNEMMRGQVTDYIKAQGFKDLGKSSGNTVPAKLFPIKTDKPEFRIDYAFASNSVDAKKFEVLTDEPFSSLSDHYPITFEI